MSCLRIFLSVLRYLAKAAGYLLLLLAICIVLMQAVEYSTLERYAPGDKPHRAFQVLVRGEDGAPRLIFLRDVQAGMQPVTKAPLSEQLGGGHSYALEQTAPATFYLRADRETFISRQHYRIENQRIVPLDFRWRHIGQGFIVFLLAFPLLGLGRFLWRKWRRKHRTAPARAADNDTAEKA